MKVQRRLDYTAPSHHITEISLDIQLDPSNTLVTSSFKIVSQDENNQTLVLNGEGLTLISVAVDGIDVSYAEAQGTLTLEGLPQKCEVTIVNSINPAQNKALEGLYMAGDTFCTQCEAEGFRRITYFLDRPDVLSIYTVTIHADAKLYPYLLSNGNQISNLVDENGIRHSSWHDPHPKPCYLFALVAGDFDVLKDTFVRQSGRPVDLHMYVDKGFSERARFALESLKRAMAWDEKTFGLEYDLDIYMIVAVDFFNMGAMENKGLNVFNSKFIFADSETATDQDYFNVESVVAHEYFHNWSGNRVTCRDWFQLSLKEGLTVFRDQLFSADMASPLTTRLDQVKTIREHQFAEDSSAMSHPIRPDEVMEMNNFYTVTVYDKGAEVIRMLYRTLGVDNFKQGLALYFKTFDGQAVTCDDFIDCMQQKSPVDLTHFRRWYSQSGTPTLNVRLEENKDDNRIKAYLVQEKDAMSLVLDVDAYNKAGLPAPMVEIGEGITRLSEKTYLFESQQSFMSFEGEKVDNTLVTLHGNFSSPMRVNMTRTAEDYAYIIMHDADPFNRWDALQSLYIGDISCRMSEQSSNSSMLAGVLDTLIKNENIDNAELAEYITIPSLETLIQALKQANPHKLNDARLELTREIANKLNGPLNERLASLPFPKFEYCKEQAADRRLRRSIFDILGCESYFASSIHHLYQRANNMTDSLTALHAAQACDSELFDILMHDFEDKWADDALVMDKWFALQATNRSPDILSRLKKLEEHHMFDSNNPNRVRALVGSFAFYNKVGFHATDSSGYRYLSDYVLKLDKVNPQVAARIITPLTQWQQYADEYQIRMKKVLRDMLDNTSLSKDVFEKVSKSVEHG